MPNENQLQTLNTNKAMEITLKITAEPALLQVLNALTGGLMRAQQFPEVQQAMLEPAAVKPASTRTARAPQRTTAVAVTSESDPTVTAAEPAASTQTEAPEMSIETVRALVQEKSQAGKRAELKKLLTEFGTDRVTDLDPAKYSEFYKKAEAL